MTTSKKNGSASKKNGSATSSPERKTEKKRILTPDLPIWAYACDLHKYATPPEHIVKDFLFNRTFTIAAGAAKVAHKTYFFMHLGDCVSRGIPFLGREVKQQTVVYSFLEDGIGRIGWRGLQLKIPQSGIAEEIRRLSDQDWYGWIPAEWDDPDDPLPRPPRPPKPEKIPFVCTFGLSGLKFVKRRLLEGAKGPVLWIIDTLICAETEWEVKSENDALELNRMFLELRGITNLGHTIIMPHHFRKNDRVMRGSSTMGASCDGWFYFYHDTKEPGKIAIEATSRDAPIGKIGFKVVGEDPDEEGRDQIIRFEPWEPNWEEVHALSKEESSKGRGSGKKNGTGNGKLGRSPKHSNSEIQTAIVARMSEDEPPEAWSRGRLRRTLKQDSKISVADDRLQDILSDMVEDGDLRKIDQSGRIYFTLPADSDD